MVDVTHSGPSTSTLWEQTSGPHGSVVTRTVIRDVTPGGAAQSLLAVPYYRDDACFDDGTGTDPGPKVRLRSGNEPATYVGTDGATHARTCWTPADGLPDPSFAAVPDREGDERYFQGSIGTQGLHLLLVAESDNAFTTLPLTEIDSEQRIVVLPGEQANVGERYGRYVEFPLRTIAAPMAP